MDISKWPMSDVMQLPDHCFGRRYWVGEYMGGVDGAVDIKIGSDELPKTFVVWGVLISCRSPSCTEAIRLTIRLCDALAAFTADAKLYDRLLKDISVSNILYEFYVNANDVNWVGCERQLVQQSFRRLGLVSNGDASNTYEMTVGVLISEVPRNVPDWLVKK